MKSENFIGRLRFRLVIAVACLSLAAGLFPPVSQAGTPSNMQASTDSVMESGEWRGMVYQTGPGNVTASYLAVMALNGISGSMNYPSLQCGGSLVFLNKAENVYFYRENITYGRENCIDGGMVAVKPYGNSVEWVWTAGDISVRGTLTGSQELPSCKECAEARNKCLMGCTHDFALQEQGGCVVRCNQVYRCVMMDDCY
jgi:hypothetical protein